MMNKIAVIALASVALAACEPIKPSSDTVQKQAQEILAQEGNMQVGMPAITNFTEKRLAKMLFELRDNPKITTVTYITTLDGKLVKLCDSVGYGLPYAVQYTNPQKIATSAHSYGYAILPQADPNGLFMPSSADGTWVMCLDPVKKDVKAVYVEPRVVVSPFELR